MTVNELYEFINGITPFSAQESWDNSGFLVGDGKAEITGIVTCLDVTDEEIDLAEKNGANTIVSHHPVIFRAMKSLHPGNVVFRAVAKGINIISAHTNLDKAVGGVNDVLCETLGMTYEKQPDSIGEGFVNTGVIDGIDTPEKLAEYIRDKLGAAVRYVPATEKIHRIGVCGGAGSEFVNDAATVGCDAFITGDAKYHEFLDAAAVGVTLFAAGHFETENMIAAVLEKKISRAFPDVKVILSERKCPIITIK